MKSSSNSSQQKYQEYFITASGYPNPENFAGVEYTWWQNPSNSNSLRLTKIGYKWTEKYCKIKYITVKISHDIKSKHLLQLERLFKEPYCIIGKTIHLMSESDAIMLQLHGGNLDQYLENLNNQ